MMSCDREGKRVLGFECNRLELLLRRKMGLESDVHLELFSRCCELRRKIVETLNPEPETLNPKP